MQRSTQHPRRRAWLRRLIVVAVLAAAVGALLSQTDFAQTSYIITDGDRVTVHVSETYSYDIVIRDVQKGSDDESLPISSY